MYHVMFYTASKLIKEKTFATRYQALDAITAWEEIDGRNTCMLIADHNLSRA